MKKALIITVLVGSLMLAAVLMAKPALRASQIVESDGQRQTDWTLFDLNITSTIDKVPNLAIRRLAIERAHAALALHPSIDLQRAEYAVKTIRDQHVDWYIKVPLKGSARHNANLIGRSLKSMKETSGSGLITLSGTGDDGSVVNATVGDFSGAGSLTAPASLGLHVIEPKR